MKDIRKIFTVAENRRLTRRTFVLRLEGDTSDITVPGQFVNIAVEGKFLRRPISVCDCADGVLTLLIDVVGDGTEALSHLRPGDKTDLLSGLGNGFDLSVECSRPILLGGGVGVAPLLLLGKKLLAQGKKPVMVAGYNTAEFAGELEVFEGCGFPIHISTVDGSAGVKGFVTDAVRQLSLDGDYFYACGPMPMMKALCVGLDLPGELSLDERMGCGFGACMCCSVSTKGGAKRICKEGPVFKKDELIWK